MRNNNIPQPKYYECDNTEDAYSIKEKLTPPINTKSINAQTIIPESGQKFDFEVEISRKKLIDEN